MYRVFAGTVPAASGVTLIARVLGQLGQPITQSSLSGIAYTVTDLQAGEVVATGTFTVSASVYNDLVQNDPRWTFDSQYTPGDSGLWGYNFLAVVPATDFDLALPDTTPAGYPAQPPPRMYQVDVAFTPMSGQVFRQAFMAQVGPNYG